MVDHRRMMMLCGVMITLDNLRKVNEEKKGDRKERLRREDTYTLDS